LLVTMFGFRRDELLGQTAAITTGEAFKHSLVVWHSPRSDFQLVCFTSVTSLPMRL
jgi:hypothetical protein